MSETPDERGARNLHPAGRGSLHAVERSDRAEQSRCSRCTHATHVGFVCHELGCGCFVDAYRAGAPFNNGGFVLYDHGRLGVHPTAREYEWEVIKQSLSIRGFNFPSDNRSPVPARFLFARCSGRGSLKALLRRRAAVAWSAIPRMVHALRLWPKVN